jgi:GntR family transcriptional regulator of arabinose operon
MSPKDKLIKGPVALYEQMRIKILELILERKILPHDPIPSEGELADLFGVSRRTSKQALQSLAEEGIVYRMPRRGTFLAEGNLDRSGVRRTTITRTIGFLVPEINDYIGQIIASAVKQAKVLGYEIIIRISDGDMNVETEMLKELTNELQVDGLLLFPGDRRSCGNEVLRLHIERFPIVIVDRTFKELEIPSVYHNHFQGAYDMTQYLIELGHSYIGFLSQPILGVMSREERYYGYIQAHQELGISLQSRGTHIDLNLDDKDRAVRELEKYIKVNPEMTAIFSSNDYLALHVSYAAQNLGISIPEQLSIVGFTDLPICDWMRVPLTSVRKNTKELGSAAVTLLSERMNEPDKEPYNHMLNTEIHERKSVRKNQVITDK